MAELFQSVRDVFQPLIDAHLVLATQEQVVFNGIERDVLTTCDRPFFARRAEERCHVPQRTTS